MIQTKITYEKHNSFHNLCVTNGKTDTEEQTNRALRILASYSGETDKLKRVLSLVEKDLKDDRREKSIFKIEPFVADEMHLIDDKDLPRFLFHRYRYEIFPQLRQLDEYPPYLQIEPSSICNYRCIFCYQTDQVFSGKKSSHMGTMSLEIFKDIIDQAEGKIEFVSLASRGEPLICRNIDKMMEYSSGKFLNLKVNTNASLLSEKFCHALLCGGAKTIVFSADAAEEPLYSKFRVRGKLEKVLKNIERFKKIRETEYSKTQVITRVSGVMVDDVQNMESMKKLWGGLVDQISFVKYNPWENVYESPLSEVTGPCSDLWRRMFVWFDGKVNPCDTDYKSELKVGNMTETSVSELWLGEEYKQLREDHSSNKRKNTYPCNRCVVA